MSKVFAALSWDFFGRITSTVIGFTFSIILARILVPEDFGLLAMVNVIISIASIFIDFGFGSALIQRKEIDDSHYGSVFYVNVALGLFLTLVTFFCAPLIANFYKTPELLPITKAMSLVFVLSAIGNVLRTKLKRELNFRELTISTIIGSAVSGIISISMAYAGRGIWSLVANGLLNPLVSNIALFMLVKWRPKLLFQSKAIKELWGIGSRMFISMFLDLFYGNFDSITVGKIFMARQLGFYYRAMTLKNYTIEFGASSVNNVIFPLLSGLQDDHERFNQTVRKGFDVLCLITFFLIGLFFLVADDMILFLLTEKWKDSILIFRILLLMSFAVPTGYILQSIISSKGKLKLYLNLNYTKKILLTFSFPIGYYFGFLPFLSALVAATVIGYFLTMYFSLHLIKEPLLKYLKTFFFYFATAAFIVLSIIALNQLVATNHHFVSGLVKGTLFTSLFYLIMSLNKTQGYYFLYNLIYTKYKSSISGRVRWPIKR